MTNHFIAAENYLSLAQQVLHNAKQQGATQAEVVLSIAEGYSVEVRLGEVESLQYHQEQGMEITVYFEQCKGTASTRDLTLAALALTTQKACQIAQVTEADACHGLADKALLAYDYPELALYHPWDLSVTQAINLAKNCEQLGLAQDQRIVNSEGVSLSTLQGLHVYANSHDFMGHYYGTQHALSCVLLAEQAGEKQRDAEFTQARNAKDLWSINQVAQQAAQKTLARLQPRKLSTRKSPVLFNPAMARSLIRHFNHAIAGRPIYQQASFLGNHLGKAVFPDFIELRENPHLLSAIGSLPFDQEGVATPAKALVSQGILQTYLLSSYSARKLGLSATGNAGGVHNLTLQPTAGNLTALLKMLDTGLFVTELMGQGVNILTGDYSRGATGFWVEQGVIQYPVAEITIAGNLSQMFKQIIACGDDVDRRSNIINGSILLEQMMIGGA